MTGRGGLRLSAKALHDIASIGYGGGVAAGLVINHTADRTAMAEFAVARQLFAAIAQYVLLPSMAVVVVSGLIALAATRAYMNAGWAWLKALLGFTVFQATLMLVSAARDQAEMAAAGADAAAFDALLRAERYTLWLLIAMAVVNVLLAVWRPRPSWKVR
ncbi:MAG: hypothetical protein JNN18_00165 [Rubrivivax sp.]|nr:hypothetical protein [Rubrivivax sp.]